MPRISLNCREGDEHLCTGCECRCHHEPIPADFREWVADAIGGTGTGAGDVVATAAGEAEQASLDGRNGSEAGERHTGGAP